MTAQDIKDLVAPLIPILGEAGAKLLTDKLEDIVHSAKEPWKKTILNLVIDAVEKYGVSGLQMAWDVIDRLTQGKPPKIDWADLRVASDILAQMQNAEADQKSAAKDFMTKVTEDIGHVIGSLLKGLLGSV